jgi:hypothetical protein
MPEKKVIVFDLDGTLADTTNLELLDGSGRRTPADILQFTPSFEMQNIFLFKPSLKKNISNLILCGIHVYVITRAPKAYASTLISLLGIDFCGLIPANSELRGVEEKLQRIAEIEQVEKSEMLYVGDQLADSEAAVEFGCDFQFPPWNKNLDNDNGVEILEKLIDTCNSISEIPNDFDPYEIQYVNTFARSNALLKIVKNSRVTDLEIDFENFNLSFRDKLIFQGLINKPVLTTNVLRPIINPHFITRYEYDKDPQLRGQLFEILQVSGFNPLKIKSPGIDEDSLIKDVEIYTVFDYRDPIWGSTFWRLIKDWRGTHSGPEVHLHYLEFIALVLAAAVGIEESDNPSVIIPVPSSPFSVDQPGQVSNRLCARISELTSVPILHFLTKEKDRTYNTELNAYPFTKKHIFLIDDQITHGRSLNGCLEVLKNLGIRANQISSITWSASRPESIDLLNEESNLDELDDE